VLDVTSFICRDYTASNKMWSVEKDIEGSYRCLFGNQDHRLLNDAVSNADIIL
jgi:hypothetical protein